MAGFDRAVAAQSSTMSRLARLVPAISIGLSACGTGGGEVATTVVRDSAGIEIVENHAPAWAEGEEWRLDPTPLVDIGALQGPPEYQLFQVSDAIRFDDGRVVVANAGTGELRYYEPDGRHLFTAGRQGGGPGEFEAIGWIEPLGADSVLAYDSRLRRLSTFDPAGGFVGTRTIESISGSALGAIGSFADGSLLLQEPFAPNPTSMSTGLRRFPSVLVRGGADEALAGIDTLGTYPGTEGMLFIGENSVSIMRGGLMHRLVLGVAGETFLVGTQVDYELVARPMTGGPGRRIRWSGPDLALTPEVIERYRQERLAEVETDAERRSLGQTLSEIQFPETLPAYGAFVVDALGNLWIERFRLPGESRNRWDVFDPEGRLLGGVEMPPGLEVFQIGQDFVLGRWTDDLDMEHVRVYRLRRG